MKKTLVFFALVQFVLISCATVSFNVDHPPLIDLRGVNSITVIPFEWDSIMEYTYLSNRVTYALLSGIRRGNINVVDPYSLENVYTRNYSRYADVYILGKIINVRVYDDVQTREERRFSETRIITTTIRDVYVDIEYAYFRSVDNQALGRFYKTVFSSDTVERTRRAGERQDRQDSIYGTNPGRGNAERSNAQRNNARRDMQRGAARRAGSFTRQRLDAWANAIAAAAIPEFSGTMDNELGAWTTREKRSVRGNTSSDPQAAEAERLIMQGEYKQALDIFSALYERSGNVFFGYNTAILLAANNRFTEALALLERIDRTITDAGKKSPSYIKNEITKMTGYINGFKILQSAQSTSSAQGNASAPAPQSRPSQTANRTVNTNDENGRILTQTTYNSRDEIVSVVRNTWTGDRLTSVTTTEGSNIKKTEYDYNALGDRVAQRDYNNGALERQILIQGRREIEELYLNGVITIRAVWENGIKVSEERFPQR